MVRVPFAEMQRVIRAAFVNAGMNERDAELCSRIHTESTCDGVNSHGLNRVSRFVDYIEKGWVKLDGKPYLVKRLSAIEIYDGDRGPGILNALFATEDAQCNLRPNKGQALWRVAKHDALDAGRGRGWLLARRTMAIS